MSGATGAGSTGTSTGTETDGGRGSAARATDSHTTNLKPVTSRATDSRSPDTHGSRGGTVTDTRGRQAQAAAGQQQGAGSPLPGERQSQQATGPYHPPQAYQAGDRSGSVRRPRTDARTAPRTRKARLRVAKADPWSVMKVSFLLSIALGICTIVAATVLWMVMNAMGVFSTVGDTISEATGSNESNGFDLQSFLSLSHVLMFTTIIAVIDVVLATALATLGAFIYNLSAGFVGGIELTLAEDE
ncbi:DUF3566 domain-containing protein [Streptomyces sp. NPDC015220]|uniref:DUF3566 domain-containing protein n=1 Tax=Streptomyces sp. NPDC015220 TaxID=3364947 RepID=UPI00370263F6